MFIVECIVIVVCLVGWFTFGILACKALRKAGNILFPHSNIQIDLDVPCFFLFFFGPVGWGLVKLFTM